MKSTEHLPNPPTRQYYNTSFIPLFVTDYGLYKLSISVLARTKTSTSTRVMKDTIIDSTCRERERYFFQQFENHCHCVFHYDHDTKQ